MEGETFVYLDVMLVENLLINYLLLYVVDRICICRARKIRITAGALAGSLYAGILLLQVGGLTIAPVKIGISMVMILISFGFHGWKRFIKRLVMFYFFAFVLSGAAIMLFFLSETRYMTQGGMVLVQDLTWWQLGLGALIANVIAKVSFDYLDNHYRRLEKILSLKLCLDNQSIEVDALLDSGNSLRDPISGKRVSIVSWKRLRDIVPAELHHNVEEYHENPEHHTLLWDELETLCVREGICITMIPFRSVGVEKGILLGMQIDSMEVRGAKGVKVIEKPIVALYNSALTSDGQYDAIVYSEIMKE